jgi:multiple sugar transport system permease protein
MVTNIRWVLVRRGAFKLGWHLIAIAGAVAMVLPLLWMISASLQTMAQVVRFPPAWIPDPIAWENYPTALTFLPFGLYFRNTLYVTGMVIVGDLFSNVLAAYGFARYRFPGRDLLFVALLSTMMLPGIVRLIPTYLLFHRLHWINTFAPLIVPSFFGSPFLLFLLRQFFLGIPDDLTDAAHIDGGSELAILWRIVLPLAKPALATVAIFSFQASWNDFMGPMIFLTDERLRTVALGLHSFKGLPYMNSLYNQLMAASTVMVLPVLLVFALFQRHFVQGVTLTGIRG